jgi:SAM-dependent methyltransferase
MQGNDDKTRFNSKPPEQFAFGRNLSCDLNEDVFESYGAFYDSLYHDKDYEVEAAYVAGTLRSVEKDAQDLLEFGSGTGRHGRWLAQQGFHVVGVERSDAMVAIARNASNHSACVAGTFELLQGDIRKVNLSRIFDGVISLFHVVSYQARNSDVMQTLVNAARHLRPGGLFLFDVWHGPAVLSQRPSVRVKRVEDDSMRLIRIAEPDLDTQNSVVTVRYTVLVESKRDGHLTTFAEEHHIRYFFPSEIDLLANRTGFEVERSEEFLTGQPPSESTWGVAYLLRKCI